MRALASLLISCCITTYAYAADAEFRVDDLPPLPSAGESAAESKSDAKPPVESAAPSPEITSIVLQGLNKVTAHISRLEAPIGTVMRFGNLEIIAKKCWKSAPDEQPENAALLEIWELKPGESPEKIFLGWMFSSSPGLAGLEHPVYDITILDCEAKPESDPDGRPQETPAADHAPRRGSKSKAH